MSLHVPVVACAYGEPKTGKSVDCLYSFPNAIFIASPGALKPAYGVCGYTFAPAEANAKTITEAIKVVKDNAAALRDHVFSAVVCDDYSILAEREKDWFDATYKSKNGYAVWDHVREKTIEFIEVLRGCGVHGILNAHKGEPRTNAAGKMFKGGPKLPCDLAEHLPALCDLVLKAEPQLERRFFKMGYRCNPGDPRFVSGDRDGSTPDYAPMNLGEILRFSKYPPGHPQQGVARYRVPRAKGYEAHEALVEQIAERALPDIADKAKISAMVQALKTKLESKMSHLHIRWIIRDGLDRAVLRRAQASIFEEVATSEVIVL